jgi:hypothetical protein
MIVLSFIFITVALLRAVILIVQQHCLQIIAPNNKQAFKETSWYDAV